MRYSILDFNQEELIKYDIDMTDVLLLDYIQKALSQPSMYKIIQNGQPYVWLQHAKILEDLPILGIKKNMLKKRIAKLVELELIATETIASEYGRGSRSYYTVTEAFESLQMTRCKKLHPVESPGVKNYTSNNKLIKDKNINILSKDSILSGPGTTFTFGTKQTQPKQSMWNKCVSYIDDFTSDKTLRSKLIAALTLFLDNSKESGIAFYTNNFKGKLNALQKLSEDVNIQIQIVQQTLDNGWNGFYEIKQNSNRKTNNFAEDVEHLTGGLNERAKKGGIKSGQKF